MLNQPIPLQTPDENSAELPLIEECHEPLVSLAGLTDKIQVHSYYFQLGHPHSLPGCFVRKGVADRLNRAAEALPARYYLHVFDGWRPLEVQQSIYDDFKTKLRNQGYTEGDVLDQELSKYVAKPIYRPEKPLGHLSGGAIDVSIGGPFGLLDMGTDFDDFTSLARTNYFETLPTYSPSEAMVRTNRRWLYNLMMQAGFVNYAEEWWHYDYGNIRWAIHNNTRAVYGGILRL